MIRNLLARIVASITTSITASKTAPKRGDPTQLLKLAGQQLAAGALDAAAATCREALTIAPGDIDVLGTLGAIVSQQGKVTEALDIALQLCRLEPENAEHPMRASMFENQLGHRDAARTLCRQALSTVRRVIETRHRAGLATHEERVIEVHAHRLLSNLELPGEPYISVLTRLHQHLRPRTYVEVGVFKAETLVLANEETLSIGIDPEPQISVPLNASTRVHAETSDRYFADHDVRAELGGLPVDMAFIDGMHNFEFALRDFINLERLCTRDSVILVHDCYPMDRISAERERMTGFWSGDIWRLVLLLRKNRPDLEVRTIAANPTGLALITRLDPDSRTLAGRLDELTAEYLALDYAELGRDKDGMLNLFPNDWEQIRACLPAPFSATKP